MIFKESLLVFSEIFTEMENFERTFENFEPSSKRFIWNEVARKNGRSNFTSTATIQSFQIATSSANAAEPF
jgi:hypothetical protein